MDDHQKLIGNINTQHEKLLEKKDALLRTKSDQVNSVEVSDALTAMINYSQLHFDYEENVMKTLGYAGTDEHIQQHLEFLERTSQFCVNTMNRTPGTKKELCSYLTEWLEQHMEKADAELGLFIRKHLLQS